MRGALPTTSARGSRQRPSSPGTGTSQEPGLRPLLAARASPSLATSNAGAMVTVWPPSSWIDTVGRLPYCLSPSNTPAQRSKTTPSRNGLPRLTVGEPCPWPEMDSMRGPIRYWGAPSIPPASDRRTSDSVCLKSARKCIRGRLQRVAWRQGSWIRTSESVRTRGTNPASHLRGEPRAVTERG